MSVRGIRASIECDACGKLFRVDIDPGTKAGVQGSQRMPWSAWDFADDAIRDGTDSEGGFCSVQHDLHLCHTCTSKADAIGDEDYSPTRQEILEATGAL